jgi:uncharacterized protein YyaL (SSP411 family)
MLYDNALLARIYLDAYRATGDGFYRRICEETLEYVLREMTHPAGGFYSTQDADSEGEEGKFFIWTPEEIEAAVDDARISDLLIEYYGVSNEGNFEGANILHVAGDAGFAESHGMTEEEWQALLHSACERLYEVRQRRVHPGRDEKVLTSWNGMMMRAFAEAGMVLKSDAYRGAAVRNADFLLANLFDGNRLLRTWKDGRARLNAYLEDYALLVDGLIAVHQATFDLEYLRRAIDLARDMVRLFWDDSAQGFFDTGSDHEALIARPRDFFDNATPSGNSVATDVLLRLSVLTGDGELERKAVASLRALAPMVQRAPAGFGRLLSALDFHLARPQELILVWSTSSDGRGALLDAVVDAYRPNLVLAGGHEGEGADVTRLLEARPAINGLATAYVCEGFACQAPTTEPERLRRQLDGET